MRRPAVEASPRQSPATSLATIKPSSCCPPVTSSLATRRIALLRTLLPPHPNPHNQGCGASAHHRPRVRSLVAFGRRPSCSGSLEHGRHPKPCTGAAVSRCSNLRRPNYSISLSARPSSDNGTVRPSALATFKFITSSNLVGAWIGKSAGLAPRRMRPT